MMGPRLSIVVPALNEAAGIAAMLAELAPLRRAGHEVIVVDGGSDDGTAKAARPHADVVLSAPRGRAQQMNAGAAAATGDVLLFLHADTRLPADAVAAIAAALPTPDAGDCPRWGRFDVDIDGRPRVLRLVAAMMNLRSRLTGIATGDQGMFVTRALFAQVGGFPELPLMEDVALSRRLRDLAGRPACLAARVVTSGRRWEARGPWRTILLMARLRFDYWRGVDPAKLARRYAGDAAAGSANVASDSLSVRAPILQIFVKAPVPGHVKTRLAASIGPDAAAALYARLVERALDAAVAARDRGAAGPLELWYAGSDAASFAAAASSASEGRSPPETTSTSVAASASGPAPAPLHPALTRWAARSGATLHPQRGDDLGARMQAALRSALDRGRPALLIGTDCPALDAAHLAAAADALRDHDAVFVPAEDGGYVLVGLARAVDAFEGIAWSGAGVMAATRARLAAAGASWRELPPLWDVDRAEDLRRLAALDPSFTPFTAGAGNAATPLAESDAAA
jgi:rSAM/selenodomain-associated transferase 2/rSAM/selenodomain-associated transferase 1